MAATHYGVNRAGPFGPGRPVTATRRQRGFAVVAAVFILVAGAAISAAVVSSNLAISRAQTSDWLAVQAYQAARAGIEWGIWRGLYATPRGCAPAVGAMPGAEFTPAQWQGRFTVTVNCTISTQEEMDGGNNLELAVFTLVATACNTNPCPGTPGPNYIERQLRVSFEGPPLP